MIFPLIITTKLSIFNAFSKLQGRFLNLAGKVETIKESWMYDQYIPCVNYFYRKMRRKLKTSIERSEKTQPSACTIWDNKGLCTELIRL